MPIIDRAVYVASKVAPRRGAWIEISTTTAPGWSPKAVAPRRGAWIEILEVHIVSIVNMGVAPRRGAWIEIPFSRLTRQV